MNQAPEELATKALRLMEDAGMLTLRMSDVQEDYTYDYLAAILRKCSIYAEDLGDKLAELAKLKMKLVLCTQGAQNASARRRLELEKEALEDTTIKNAAARDNYVRRKLADDPSAQLYQDWQTVNHILTEAKAEVTRRASIIQKLDSDVRLHQRIIEAKMGDGPIRQDPRGVPRTRPVDIDDLADGDGLPVEDV